MLVSSQKISWPKKLKRVEKYSDCVDSGSFKLWSLGIKCDHNEELNFYIIYGKKSFSQNPMSEKAVTYLKIFDTVEHFNAVKIKD